jgi:hypothetical protein
LGIAHAICYFAFKKPVSILERYKTPETPVEIQSGPIDEIFSRIINPNTEQRRHFLSIRHFDYHCHDAKTNEALKPERTTILEMAKKLANDIDTMQPTQELKEKVKKLIGQFDFVFGGVSGTDKQDLRTKLVDFASGTKK